MARKLKADVVILNGKIITVDPNGTIAEALAIKNGRIARVGATKEMEDMVDDETKVIDLKGKTVLPGIIDCHVHLEALAMCNAYHVDVHPPAVKSVKDILNRIRDRAKQTPKGRWIIARGNFWLDKKILDERYPTKSEIDAAVPDHPVVLIDAAHLIILNSLALKLSGITRDSPQPRFGRIDKDPLTGEPTGVLRELLTTLPIPPYTHEEKKDALKKCIKPLLTEQGITTVYTMPFSTNAIRIYQELLSEGELPVRIGVYYVVGRGYGVYELDSIIKLEILPGFGNERLKFKGVKLFIDGEWESGCSAVNEPYTLETFPSEPANFGSLALTQEELTEMVMKAHRAGMHILAHATGDRAIDMFITAVEAAQREAPRRDHRHRIEHAGIMQLTSEQIDRMKHIGIIPSPQPQFLNAAGDWMKLLFGEERTKRIFAFKTLLDEGIRLPGSSDSTGTQPEAVNPFWGIWCAVARKTYSGRVLCPEERISVMDAIRMFTINSAYAGFEEKVKGSIEVGKLADLIVLSEDPLSVTIDEIKDIKVEMTILSGETVHNQIN